jgi:hypothetical protein
VLKEEIKAKAPPQFFLYFRSIFLATIFSKCELASLVIIGVVKNDRCCTPAWLLDIVLLASIGWFRCRTNLKGKIALK